MFHFGKYNSTIDECIKLQGTYTFDKKNFLNVFNDTYLSLSEENEEYCYISSSSQSVGKLIKRNKSLYFLEGNVLNNAYIVLDNNNNIIMIHQNKVSYLYQFDNSLTYITP